MVLLNSSPAPPNPIVALLADQSDDTRWMYREYFSLSSVNVEEARDGREALAKALARPHDVIVTETRLPGLSGYELCELLRSDIATRRTPILVVTAETSASHVARARKAGADSVLVKPCLPDVLLAEMRRLVQHGRDLRRHSRELRHRVTTQLSRSEALRERTRTVQRRALSRLLLRESTTAPPDTPPELVCPVCYERLVYKRSHIGGVSERQREQWDYYECSNACGTFQYRQGTRRLRKIS